MKTVIEFNLPDDQEELENAQNGWKWSKSIKDFDTELKNTIKYKPSDFKGDINTLENVRTKLHEILSDYNLRIYE